MTGKAGKADDLAGMGDKLRAVGLVRRTGAHHDRAVGRARPALLCAARLVLCAHGADKLLAVEGGGLVGGDDLAVAHDDDAVGVVENLVQEVRDQDAARARRHGRAHERREAGRP